MKENKTIDPREVNWGMVGAVNRMQDEDPGSAVQGISNNELKFLIILRENFGEYTSEVIEALGKNFAPTKASSDSTSEPLSVFTEED